MIKLVPQAEADYIRASVLARLGAIRKPADDAERRRVGGAGGNGADCGWRACNHRRHRESGVPLLWPENWQGQLGD